MRPPEGAPDLGITEVVVDVDDVDVVGVVDDARGVDACREIGTESRVCDCCLVKPL